MSDTAFAQDVNTPSAPAGSSDRGGSEPSYRDGGSRFEPNDRDHERESDTRKAIRSAIKSHGGWRDQDAISEPSDLGHYRKEREARKAREAQKQARDQVTNKFVKSQPEPWRQDEIAREKRREVIEDAVDEWRNEPQAQPEPAAARQPAWQSPDDVGDHTYQRHGDQIVRPHGHNQQWLDEEKRVHQYSTDQWIQDELRAPQQGRQADPTFWWRLYAHPSQHIRQHLHNKLAQWNQTHPHVVQWIAGQIQNVEHQRYINPQVATYLAEDMKHRNMLDDVWLFEKRHNLSQQEKYAVGDLMSKDPHCRHVRASDGRVIPDMLYYLNKHRNQRRRRR
jgi:hypothetical protein